ncbi:MAG TPA: hypothetical protein VGQ38_15510 [Gaiellaceae bacterium]|nr:hypothetical protein [Gaiellaceae bacterium]
MSAPDVFAEARAKLDAKIASAARDFVALIESEADKRSDGGIRRVSITVPADSLVVLRAQIAAWDAFNDTLGDGS